MKAVCDAVGVPYDYFYNAVAAARDTARGEVITFEEKARENGRGVV